jgi:hypothetical protein
MPSGRVPIMVLPKRGSIDAASAGLAAAQIANTPRQAPRIA